MTLLSGFRWPAPCTPHSNGMVEICNKTNYALIELFANFCINNEKSFPFFQLMMWCPSSFKNTMESPLPAWLIMGPKSWWKSPSASKSTPSSPVSTRRQFCSCRFPSLSSWSSRLRGSCSTTFRGSDMPTQKNGCRWVAFITTRKKHIQHKLHVSTRYRNDLY